MPGGGLVTGLQLKLTSSGGNRGAGMLQPALRGFLKTHCVCYEEIPMTKASAVREYKNWINGTEVLNYSGERSERKSPAHGSLLTTFPNSDQRDVDAAVSAARSAFEDRRWIAKSGAERAAILNKWVELMEQNIDKLAHIEAEEVGKPLKFAHAEIAWSIELARYAAALAWQLHGEAFTNLGDANLGLVTREPRGVVGLIVPWNFPMVTLFQKLPYALAAGCSVVIKPSDLTPGTALETAALASKAGIPAGVINVVTGAGRVVGECLTGHPGVDMISFTGSTAVGKRIAHQAADQMKRISLELGGKAANIVFADADLDDALDGVLLGMILNQGEECVAGTRLLIDKNVAPAFLASLRERAKKVRVGLPLEDGVDVGAMIHEAHMRSVLEYIDIGKKEGATLFHGGRQLREGVLANGYFVEPTIFTDVTPGMRVFREEIFGPVITATTFSGTDEAIALANDTNYGLGNGIWTKDIDKAIYVSQRLRSGTVYVNTYLETSPQMPFGGFKESGVGRENGMDGLLEFTEVKSTFIRLGKRSPALPHTA